MSMHEGQVTLTRSQAIRLVTRTLPQIHEGEIHALVDAGTTSYIYRLGSMFVARFPMIATDPAAARGVLECEHRAMAEFRRASPVPSPEPVLIGEPGESYPSPWSVHTWVDGDVATPTSAASSVDLARDLACLLAALRSADTAGRGFDGVGRGGALTDHDAWVAACLERSEGILPVSELREAWSRLRALPREDRDAMCHRDLIPPNLVVTANRLRGVLDTGTFGPADPALDLVCAWHLFDDGPRGVLREALAVPDLQWTRGAAWAFIQAIGLVWYYAESNPAMSELGRVTLGRVLANDF